MGTEDIEARAAILIETRRRLRQLELQKAKKGDNAPPELDIEIARLRKEVRYSRELATSTIEPEYAKQLGPDNQFALLAHLVDGVSNSVSMVGRRVEDIKEYLDERMTRIEVGDASYRSGERAERIAGQQSNRRLIIAVGIIFTVLILIVAAVLFAVVQEILILRGLRR